MSPRNKILLVGSSILLLVAIILGAREYKKYQTSQLVRPEAMKSEGPPRIKSEFTVLEKVRVSNPEGSLGHRFILQDDKGAQYTISLYFVESPPTELDETNSLKFQSLASYFGNVPLEKLIEFGNKARDFTLKELSTKPFKVATLFTPTKNHTGFHGFVILRGENAEEFYLSELLVMNGLAAVSAEGSYLPYGERREAFRNHLIELEMEARAAKRGIWSLSRNLNDGGALPIESAP